MPIKNSKNARPKTKNPAVCTLEFCERRLLFSTYTVNTLSDAANPVVGQLTLRQAIADANADPGPDTIAFDPTVFAAGSLHTITLDQGELSFTDTSGATTVQGPGATVLSVSGNETSRVIQISSGTTVSLSGLTITEGAVNASGGTLASGGGVQNAGELTLTGVNVSSNSITGGDDASGTYVNGSSAEGAGIYSTGTINLVNCEISSNTATAGNTVNYFTGGSADGAGIYSTGSLTITGSTINANIAKGGQTTERSESSNSGGGDGSGGGIYCVGNLTIDKSTISNNSADGQGPVGNGYGGGLYSTAGLSLSNSILSGNLATSLSGTSAGGGSQGNASGGALYASGESQIVSTEFSDNNALGDSISNGYSFEGTAQGGAILSTDSMTISASTLEGNTAVGGAGSTAYNAPGGNGYGGAIASNGALDIAESTISSNLAHGGGGQSNGQNPEASGIGGGVYSTGTLTIEESSISGNTAQAGELYGESYSAAGGSGEGGGVFTSDIATFSDTSVVLNQAIGGPGDYIQEGSGGSSDPGQGGDGGGGGVYNVGSFTGTNVTVSGNKSSGGEGAISNTDGGNGGDAIGSAVDSTGTLALNNSTVSGNTASGGEGGNTADDTHYSNGQSGTPLGAINIVSGTAVFKNSIISGNVAGSSDEDITGSINSSSGSNFIGIGGGLTNGVNGNIVGITNPDLMPLRNYGGPTETMLPLAGSPVIDAGSNALIPSGVTTDQRGYSRIVGSSVDIGSVEYTAAVSGTVFNDVNGDGIRETGDNGIQGVTVYADLSNTGAYQAGDPSTTTDLSGNYVLNGLPAGTVIIRQIIPTGDRQSYPAGGNGEHVTVSASAVAGANFADSTDLYVSGSVSLNGVGQSGVVVYADLNNDGIFENGENNKTTASDGSFAFISLRPGTYTFRVVLPTGEVQTSPTGNAGITVTLGSGGTAQGVAFTLAKQTALPLTGTVIGTSGSYDNQGNTAAKAFDGNLNTFFDAPTGSGSYAGLDLGSAKVVTSISYAPRVGWASRMLGGVFQASNSPSFLSGVVTLYTITATPATGVLTTVSFTNTSAFRYVRYMGPANSFCNIAEAQFFGSSATTFTGIVIGTTGSYDNQGNTIANAVDGNLSTFFDAPTASGSWVGLDLGSSQTVTQVEYAPRSGWAARMVGGQFQASNSANFTSGVVTLFTISSTPATGVLTTQLLTNTTAYRYYRYIGPSNSFCNIAELVFVN